ncbi:hypothetical protein MPTK1_1g29390 [Marchantia polymorpha subsp. ruderalis]|uniref:Uncharacterized protein n=2 Tax=Marchantia polymorpha TaxID=3197 RepID=A0AAF6AVI7_MARPO|nr:hypothetical protein MARPO_0107s0054 [Marchantia polymorpha]BBN00458.1 hypothetical protein Mp_1g29390 [Marchantia polymorpha subsp. ruderalis]|eukprot:PTQ31787.1 hypothetical protein MARPO_0107s0054 [Marchantia polymorpha]
MRGLLLGCKLPEIASGIIALGSTIMEMIDVESQGVSSLLVKEEIPDGFVTKQVQGAKFLDRRGPFKVRHLRRPVTHLNVGERKRKVHIGMADAPAGPQRATKSVQRRTFWTNETLECLKRLHFRVEATMATRTGDGSMGRWRSRPGRKNGRWAIDVVAVGRLYEVRRLRRCIGRGAPPRADEELARGSGASAEAPTSSVFPLSPAPRRNGSGVEEFKGEAPRSREGRGADRE